MVWRHFALHRSIIATGEELDCNECGKLDRCRFKVYLLSLAKKGDQNAPFSISLRVASKAIGIRGNRPFPHTSLDSQSPKLLTRIEKMTWKPFDKKGIIAL